MQPRLILLGAGALLLLVAGIALWRMAASDARAPSAAPRPGNETTQQPPPKTPAVPVARPDAAEAARVAEPPPEPPRSSGRAPVILGRLREAVSRTDAEMTRCINTKLGGRALLQFTAVPHDGRVSIEHMEVLPNVGKEATTITDRALLDCFLKAAAGTHLTDVGPMPVILRTRVVIEDGALVENWVTSATPQSRDD